MLSAVIQAIGSITTRPLMTVTVASSAIANPEVLIEKCKHSASLPTNVVFLVDQGAVHSRIPKKGAPPCSSSHCATPATRSQRWPPSASACLSTNVVFLVDQGAGNVFTSAPGGLLLVFFSPSEN